MSHFKNRTQDTITEAECLVMKLDVPSLWFKKTTTTKKKKIKQAKNPNPFPRRDNIIFRE